MKITIGLMEWKTGKTLGIPHVWRTKPFGKRVKTVLTKLGKEVVKYERMYKSQKVPSRKRI